MQRVVKGTLCFSDSGISSATTGRRLPRPYLVPDLRNRIAERYRVLVPKSDLPPSPLLNPYEATPYTSLLFLREREKGRGKGTSRPDDWRKEGRGQVGQSNLR